MKDAVLDEMRHHFRPEFLNRVDEIIVFHALTRGAPEADRRDPARPPAGAPGGPAHHAGLTDARAGALVRTGYDPTYGARPLKRAIQKKIENPLGRLLLKGEVRDGQTVVVDADSETGDLKFVPEPCREWRTQPQLSGYFVKIVASTFIPGRRIRLRPADSTRILTGMRCTTFTKLPVAFSGGSKLSFDPVALAMESTRPVTLRLYMSTSISARWPGRTLASCVSLKFAVTQTSCSGTMAISPWPGATICPTSTLLRVTIPSIDAVIVV